MFSVNTTYYCASCRKVKVKEWKHKDGKDALQKFDYVTDKHFDNEDIHTSFVELRWTKDDETTHHPKSATLYYYHKSMDATVSGADVLVMCDEEVKQQWNELHNMAEKEAA